MKTRDFLKQYTYVYLYVICFFLVLASGLRGAVEAVDSPQSLTATPVYLIDAGHGGIDGGTTSCSGVLESRINLEIARRLERLMALLGYETVLVRPTEESIATEGETIRQQKQSDLRNRVALAGQYPTGILVSIHQNHYTDSRYAGPQVFHRDDSGSKALAERVQTTMNQTLNPSVRRSCKKAEGVYLMKNIQCTGILIECGFLSNPEEDRLLQSEEYQKKLCSVIAAALADA